MTHKADFGAYVDAIKASLQRVHEHGVVLDKWAADEDLFIKDLLDLVRTSYAAGYDDALQDVRQDLRKLESDIDTYLKETNG